MLQKKVILSNQGYRLTAEVPTHGWRRSIHSTVVVRKPNTRRDTFVWSLVATEGIQGQPQMTFDTEEAATTWLRDHRAGFGMNGQYLRVGRTRQNYTCIKIPLSDGSECWLAESNFPAEGSEEWDRLVRLYPEYFRRAGGLFREAVYTRPDIHLQEGDEFKTNSEEIVSRLPGSWLMWDTEFHIEEVDDDGNCEVSYWDEYLGRSATLNNEVGDITLKEIEQQCNIPGMLKSYNGNEILPQKKTGLFKEDLSSKSFTEEEIRNLFATDKTDDELAQILFERSNNYVFKTNLLNVYPDKISEYFPNANVSLADAMKAYHDLSEYGLEHGIQYHSLMFCSTKNEGSVRNSYCYYCNPEAIGFHRLPWFNPTQWWDFVKKSILTWEKLGIRERRGLFSENLTDNKLQTIDNNKVKKVILGYVKENGYMKGSYGYHNNNGTSYRGSPTVAEIIRILDEGNFDSVMASDEVYNNMNTWVNELVPEGPFADYQNRCKEIWNKEHITRDDINMVASFCNSYFKELQYKERQAARQERERQHQAAVDSESNTWAGQVGDMVEFVIDTCKISHWIEPRSYYADSYPSWTMKGTDGRTYTWNDTKNEVQLKPGMTIKGKIKNLSEFRGIKQTQIWRIEVLEGQKRVGLFTEELTKYITPTSEAEWEALPTWKKAWRLNNIISSLNDEEAYYGGWLYIWPDGESEEDCKYDFESQANYKDLEDSFKRRYSDHEIHSSGLYTSGRLPLETLADAFMWDKKLGLKPIKWYDSDSGQWVRQEKRGLFGE